VLACEPLFPAGNSVVSVPAEIQHFGPLLVVATHEDSPDPETYRSDLFSDKPEERMRLLRAIGIESIPELHGLWIAFLHDHAGEDQGKVIGQFISGGMLVWNFGEPGSKQVVLGAGFDEASGHPLELEAVFNLKDGHWTHVATLACRCEMGSRGEPDNFTRPDKPLPQQELVVTLHRRTVGRSEYHAQEIRFRLRGGLLWPLIEFESRSTICPIGVIVGPNCHLTKTDFESAQLIGEDENLIPGFELVSWSGNPPAADRIVMRLYNPVCAPYSWDETSFAYLPSPLRPAACGVSSKQASRQRSQTPSGAKSPSHE
jgi:hypothetical protein